VINVTDSLCTATRVLVIDDSVLVRRVLTRAFEHEPTIEVLGATRNGRAALDKVEAVRPDVVVLDSAVAGRDGFATLSELRRRQPELCAIIFSRVATGSLGQPAAEGATKFAFNPTTDGIGLTEESARSELLPLIRAFGARTAPGPGPATPTRARPRRQRPVSAIVIAVSTGGPDALAEVVGRLPADLPVPVLVVQHMPPDFTRMLAERLDRQSAVCAVEASAGEELSPGVVYIAPGGRHMAVTRTTGRVAVVLHDGPRENSCRPAADVLFRAAAEVYRDQVLAVVLTGMGQDGLRGAEAVRDAGGSVIVQSESSSVVASMPATVAAAGLADAVVALEDLGAALVDHVYTGR
jgi:two-component system chemotaxis response regulator CheB